jgi:hypothetical protein
MLAEIHQDVDQCVAHRPRRREGAGVEPVVPHATATAQHAVHGAREADGESADSSRKRVPVFGLRDEMDMVVLYGKLHDPELGVR